MTTRDDDRANRSGAGVGGGSGPLEGEAANDHILGVDRDAVVVLVTHVNRRAATVIDPVRRRRTRFRDRHGRVLVPDANRLALWETFAPRGGRDVRCR